MEKWDARPFQQEQEYGWNVLELESRIYLRSKIHELIDLTNHSTLTTSDIRERLRSYQSQFGPCFTTQLVRALQREDPDEQGAAIWLLTQLNDQSAIPLLQKMSQHKQHPRRVRLSAALVLAGMGATKEMATAARPHLYAIS